MEKRQKRSLDDKLWHENSKQGEWLGRMKLERKGMGWKGGDVRNGGRGIYGRKERVGELEEVTDGECSGPIKSGRTCCSTDRLKKICIGIFPSWMLTLWL